MGYEGMTLGVGIDALKHLLRKIRKQVTKQQYDEMVSGIIAELLSASPDMTKAKADLLAANALGVTPSAEYFRAEDMLAKVVEYDRREAARKGRGPKKAAKKKTAKKKAAKKKAAKKKTAKKKSM